jgi:uncharacterized protein YegL
MAKRPGGTLATRPLHFIWTCDGSGSMGGSKIQALNNAIREALPHMRQVAAENPYATVLLRSLRFSHGAEWHISTPTPLDTFAWTDLEADPVQQPSVDIVFMLDTSGSMNDEIEGVKRSCITFANQIIAQKANVRLGLIGFDIGGYQGAKSNGYTIHQLSYYTIGVWPLAEPEQFSRNVQSLSLGLFGGRGCYLANKDTEDIFPHVVRAFDGPEHHTRVLVIISDEMGNTAALDPIVNHLKNARIVTHVLGVPGTGKAHEQIANQTGGQFWDITRSKGSQDFGSLLGVVATTIAKEVTKKAADGTLSSGTDIGAAMRKLAEAVTIPPLEPRALPPVLVLLSDGQPTDDFAGGLKALMDQPWGKKAVRIAIAIGQDADLNVLQQFIGNSEVKPLQAHNPDALVRYIRWASTAVLKAASEPVITAPGLPAPVNVPPMVAERVSANPDEIMW